MYRKIKEHEKVTRCPTEGVIIWLHGAGKGVWQAEKVKKKLKLVRWPWN